MTRLVPAMLAATAPMRSLLLSLLLPLSLIAGCSTPGSGGQTPEASRNERLLSADEQEARRAASGETPVKAAPPATTAPPGAVGAPATCAEFARPGVLRRTSVVRAVDGGLGRWLSQVRVTAVRQSGRFGGWQILRLYPDDPCYQGVDLRPGDVVTRVNGNQLERPEQANVVFQGLRAARALDIELLRDGQPRRVSLAIAD